MEIHHGGFDGDSTDDNSCVAALVQWKVSHTKRKELVADKVGTEEH